MRCCMDTIGRKRAAEEALLRVAPEEVSEAEEADMFRPEEFPTGEEEENFNMRKGDWLWD